MSDNLHRRTPEDPTRINRNQNWELGYWAQTLGVSVEQLLRAIDAVGPMVADVRRYLRK